MGLKEYIRQGAALKRTSVELQTTIDGSGSVDLGSAYVLLSVQTDVPCRLRLYDTLSGLNDFGEINRSFENVSISSSVSLVGDFSMSAPGTYTVDPALYGVVNSSTYYRVENAPAGTYPKITFFKYLLEDANISTANRTTVNLITGSLNSGEVVSGSISSIDVPTTYLFVSATLTNGDTNGVVRVRLYSTADVLTNTSEQLRAFVTESTVRSLLIDAILSGSDTTYFSPKIIGANLQNIGNNLSTLKGIYLNGLNEMYYILENISSSTSPMSITASLHLFALEN